MAKSYIEEKKVKIIKGFATPRYLDEKWYNNFTISKSQSKSNDIPVTIVVDNESYESFFTDYPCPTYRELSNELSEARNKITKLDKANRLLKDAYDILKEN